MHSTIYKRTLFIFLLLCAFPFFFGVSATAQLTEDGKVDVVQSHFHFKDPNTGADIDHNALKTILLHREGDLTLLDQAYTFCFDIDERTLFGRNIYTNFGPDLINVVFDIYGFDPTWQDIGLKSLFKAEQHFVPLTASVFEVWDGLSDNLGVGFVAIPGLIDVWTDIVTNQTVVAYLSVRAGPDDDAEAWELAKYYAQVQNPEQVHQYCQTIYDEAQRLKIIQPEIDDFTSRINHLIKGGVQFDYSPDSFSLFAPVTLTIDASGSTGAFGNSISSYQWTVDGSQVSTQPQFQATYWTVGQHTVQCIVTDSQGNQIAGNDTFFVSPRLSASLILTPIIGRPPSPRPQITCSPAPAAMLGTSAMAAHQLSVTQPTQFPIPSRTTKSTMSH